MQKKKERLPQNGCMLDTVFWLCTITGTQGAAERAFALQTFADADTQAGTNLMDKAEYARLFRRPCIGVHEPYICIQETRARHY